MLLSSNSFLFHSFPFDQFVPIITSNIIQNVHVILLVQNVQYTVILFRVQGILEQDVYILNISRANTENVTSWEKEYSYKVLYIVYNTHYIIAQRIFVCLIH